ncbi:MAG: translation initiation factor IF-2 [Clostridiales bacterium]|nr:translation initiation factor IF-2 [Clostridiales bacterium]
MEVCILARSRVYEVAKALNITSKRLLEKLKEISIDVKNHMSLLTEEEIGQLYKHVGFVQNNMKEDKVKSGGIEGALKKDRKKGPVIIRKRQIYLDGDESIKENKKETNIESKKEEKKAKGNGSGLRQGFVYEDNSYDRLLEEMKAKNMMKQREEKMLKADEKNNTVDETKAQINGLDAKVELSSKKDVIKKSSISKTKEVAHFGYQNKNVSDSSQHNKDGNKSQLKNEKDKIVSNMRRDSMNRKTKEQGVLVENKGQGNNRGNGAWQKDNATKKNNKGYRSDNVKSSKTKELNEKQAESLSKQERRESSIKSAEKEKKREQKKENLSIRSLSTKDSKYDGTKKYIKTGKGGNTDTLIDEYYDEQGKFARKNRAKNKNMKEEQKTFDIPKAVVKNITVAESVTVKELAEAMKKTAAEVIKKLMFLGMMVTVNSELDFDTAVLIGDEFDIKVEKQVEVKEEDILFKDDELVDESKMIARPPVVVVMGHVDHGKTSLLDAIRKTNVTTGEAGGITQHIGAHTVKINNKSITFLDTPGHEAFTAMRARGAEVTDIVVLVVAADDGVMPQTIEAINHAKAANVSIIVAVNKIDKEGANPDKVKKELSEYGLIPEEWGGDTIFVQVSAKKNQGIENLLEMITLVSEMLELKANPNRQAKGTIIEAKLDKDRGPIATLLVQEGTLNSGDSIVAGVTFGRIRAMVDDKGKKIKKAGPSTPVEILGFHEVPEAGEVFHSITDEKLAKSLIEKRKLKQRQKHLKATAKVSLEELYNQIQAGNIKDLNLIVKADVQGSVEAVKQSLQKLTNDEVRINIIHGGVGAITEQDVILAQVSNAIVIGFNVRPALNVTEIAQDAGVDIRLYRVIYNAIEDIQAAMKGMLDPTYKEVVIGHVEIRQIFKVSGIGTIGGAYVLDGKITRNSEVRVIRDGIVVYEGKLASLKRFKDDAKEVAQGFECGLSIESFNDIKEGDVVEAFEMQEVER